MEPLLGRPAFYRNRAEKVSAIEEEITAGTYEIDSKQLANKMIVHWLNYSRQLHRVRLSLMQPESARPLGLEEKSHDCRSTG
ncbi:MAG: flagellar biosynthesis anti-sigma factor FlgM [Deltaproteobacteria bacterium]|nr:MAG: flagellar biosynthesis anti-sigma factor FlgM [Deltaproteobacteria bacterium]